MILLNPTDPLSRLLTLDEAAQLVDRRPGTIRSWVHRGHLPVIRVGRRVWVTERAVLEAERDVWQRDQTRGTAA